MKKKLTFLALALSMSLNQIACGAGKSTVSNKSPAQTNEVTNKKAEEMKIRITIGEKVVTATLTDSEAARDFVSLLPLTLVLEDHAKTEKSATCRESYLRRARPRAATLLSEILLTTPPGGIWRFITEISGTRTDSSSSER